MEKIKYKLLCIVVFATIFLLVNANIASAVNLNLITGNKTEQIRLDLNDFLKRGLTTVEAGNVKVDIGSSEKSPIQAALLYLCKDRNPIDCLKSLPIQYTNKVDTTLKQSDLEANGVVHLLGLIKTTNNWLADWTDIQNGAVQNTDPGEIDIYSSINSSEVKDFIQNYGMVPLSFVDKVDFKGKKIYQATGVEKRKGSSSGEIAITNITLSAELQRDQGYIFAFPTDQKTYSPLTFYNVPKICGDGQCSVGENYQTCWHDCPCPEGQVPGRGGCISRTAVKLIIDDIQESVYCVVPELLVGRSAPNASCQPSPFEVKLRIENTPVKYSVQPNSFYFAMKRGQDDSKPLPEKFSCIPTKFARSGLTEEDTKGKQPLFTGSDTEYQCFVKPPKAYNLTVGTNSRSLLFGMYMSVPSQNGTEVLEITNSTSIKLNVLGVDAVELQDVKEKLKAQKHTTDTLSEITTTLQLISNVFKVVLAAMALIGTLGLTFVVVGLVLVLIGMLLAALFCVGCGLVGIGTNFINAGKDMITQAVQISVKFLPYALIIELISWGLIGLPMAYCKGGAVQAPFFNLPALPKYLGGFPGAGIELISAKKTSRAHLGREERSALGVTSVVGSFALMGVAIGLIIAAGFTYEKLIAAGLGALIGAAVGLVVGVLLIAMLDMCGDYRAVEDQLQQRVAESDKKVEKAFSEVFSNLIWVTGNKTGKTGTICGDEKVEGLYVLDGFGCTDDLGFSFNGKTRPKCNFNSGTWVDRKDSNFLGSSCSLTNTTDYEWILQNQTGENLGFRKYNSTGLHTIFNTTASKIFSTGVTDKEISITVICEGKAFGRKIQSEFALANYTEVCP